MPDQKTFPFDVLEADQSNIQVSVDVLNNYGIFGCYERAVPALFAGLLPAVQKAAPAGYFPFTRKTGGGLMFQPMTSFCDCSCFNQRMNNTSLL
jgi:hypothetical protein